MNFSRIYDNIKPKQSHLDHYIKEYWFAPQDVLLRSVEANIISSIQLKRPILDIGVGDGGISRFLFQKKIKIDIGIDIDKNGLGNARRTGVYKKVLQADAQNMPFNAASFNTVVSNSTFEHIEDDLGAVKEVSRVLKKNGLFFMTVPNPFLARTVLLIEGNNRKAKSALTKLNKRVQHLHYRALKEWKKIFTKNNMSIVYHKYYYPEGTTRVWYSLMKFSTQKFRNREVWSYLAHSKFTKVIPKRLIISTLKYMLKNPYKKSLPSKLDKGSMIFIVAQKTT